MIIRIESGSAEPVDVSIRADSDPTAAVPAFELTAATVTTPTGSWSNGTWETAWDATSKRLTARTPTIGAAGTLAAAEGTENTLWIKWGLVVKRAATVVIG